MLWDISASFSLSLFFFSDIWRCGWCYTTIFASLYSSLVICGENTLQMQGSRFGNEFLVLVNRNVIFLSVGRGSIMQHCF